MTTLTTLAYTDPATGEIIDGPIHEVLAIARIDISGLPDDYPSLVTAGRAITEAHDTDRWALGDIAYHKIQRQWGEDKIKQFADDIGIARSTAYQFRDVSRFYERPIRLELLELCPQLVWTHFYQANRVGDIAIARQLLLDAEAAVPVWSARSKMKAEVDKILNLPPKPKKVDVFEGSLEQIVAQLTKLLIEPREDVPLDRIYRAGLSIFPPVPKAANEGDPQ